MASIKAKAWATLNKNRRKDILDVPEEMREEVLTLLPEAERERQRAFME